MNPFPNKLVIFDCDGVLVDSEHISNQALVDSLAELQIEMSVDQAVERFKGRNLIDCFAEIKEQHKCELPLSFETNFRRLRGEYFETRLKPVHGVAEALSRISHAKCVASNGPHEMIKRNLAISSLDHHFGENIFSAYQIQKWKPDPDLFLHACATMKSTPENSVVVEDSDAGVTAARAGGFKVLAYGFPHGMGANVFSFKSMAELPGLIERVFTSAAGSKSAS